MFFMELYKRVKKLERDLDHIERMLNYKTKTLYSEQDLNRTLQLLLDYLGLEISYTPSELKLRQKRGS